jgi:type I restriction enzyme, R subunit
MFQLELVEALCERGWVEGHNSNYDPETALYTEDLIGFVQDAYPETWEKLAKKGGDPSKRLVSQTVKNLESKGTLRVLREGFKDVGISINLCQFKPDHGLSDKISQAYGKNRLRVVQEVTYSLHNQNRIDLVLFVNGIPTATLELKTDFTQTVQDAVYQYKKDRPPKDPNTKKSEPLLQFKRGALVHFAVSTSEVYMTTRLEGMKSFFLPFNRGNNGGAGNPPNPEGYSISYLWEFVMEHEMWLHILGRFLHLEETTEEDLSGVLKNKSTMIFPRFHQLEAVTKMVDTVAQEGPGHSYLIQHSAGSGKSNSIAWLSYQLASLFNKNGHKVFRNVIVITDRTVLDSQLQSTITQFERTKGVVCAISGDGSTSKSESLKQALVNRTPIVIVTIQTFPFVLEAIENRKEFKASNYAIIADEAHSSQTGTTARKLKELLTTEDLDEENEELSAEEVINAVLASRKKARNISYFAFTATPKAKTLELFGRPPDPTQPISDKNLPGPFHLYSMQQAIEEKFILDVLQNYITYEMACELNQKSKDKDLEVESRKASKEVLRWVKLHEYNITQKVIVIIEHFRENVAHLLGGEARAMVVTDSRKAAVRYKLALNKYIDEKKYPLKALAAFSGEVLDSESGSDPFTEININPNLLGQDIRNAFDKQDYRFLIVANKFQTGFDQPKLCAMYVDKRLSDVDCVQTLSRLNRTKPGKKMVFILDFVNEIEEVRKAFEPYYRQSELERVSDPNKIYEVQDRILQRDIFNMQNVEEFAVAFFAPIEKVTQKKLQALLTPARDRFRVSYLEAVQELKKLMEQIENLKKANLQVSPELNLALKTVSEKKSDLEAFRKDLGSFHRFYEFISQVVQFDDEELEKFNVYCRHLYPLLRLSIDQEDIDLSSLEMTRYRLDEQGKSTIQLGDGPEEETKLIPGDSVASGRKKDPKKELMSQILERLNEILAGEGLTDADRLNYATWISDKILENEVVVQQIQNNPREQAKLGDFNVALLKALSVSQQSHDQMAKSVLTNQQTMQSFNSIIFDLVHNRLHNSDQLRAP